VLAYSGQGVAEVGQRLGIIGSQFHRPAVGVDGLIRPAELLQGDAFVAPGFGEIVLEIDGPLSGPEGFGAAIHPAQDGGEVVVVVGFEFFELDGFADQLEGFVELAAMHGREAQEVQGLGAVGLDLEHAMVDRLGLGGLAGAEVGLGEFQEGVEFDGVHGIVFPGHHNEGTNGEDEGVKGGCHLNSLHFRGIIRAY